MTTPTLAPGEIASLLRRRLLLQSREVAAQIAVIVANNPAASARQILGRPDVLLGVAALADEAGDLAREAVQDAWAAGPDPVQAALLADVRAQWASFPADVDAAILRELASDGQPGQIGYERGLERARAVRSAIEGIGAGLATRSVLSVLTAERASLTVLVRQEAEQREQAGERIGLEWHSRMDARTCPWCRALNGTVVNPGQQFPHPSPIGRRRPPRVYQGVLFGPPLHPHCRCSLRIVSLGQGPLPPAPTPELAPDVFVSSDDIRALPQDRYDTLIHFLSSAVHELGQLVRKLLHFGKP